MKNFLPKIKHVTSSFFSQGLTPKEISIAVSLGICIGIMPVLGITTLLCTGISLYLRLNLPLIQATNYVVYPIQLILFIPFFKAGTFVSGQNFNYSLSDIRLLLDANLSNAIQLLVVANLYAFLVWILVLPFLFGILYVSFFHLLKGFEKKQAYNSIMD